MPGLSDDPVRHERGPEREVYTISELNSLVRGVLEGTFSSIWLEGEISNLRRYPSGHTYFTLKDDQSQISSVLFRGNSPRLQFRPEDGMKVLAFGRISLYEARGSFQIIVERMEPAGIGTLQLAFEQLKKRLAAEGLFDPDRKRTLPALPRRLGIVTSPTGAAVRDVLRVLRRRFPGLEVVIAPARVQGEGAAAEIVAGIRDLNLLGDVDVIMVTRGGGSLEDLWPFNEESVARAIVGSAAPVISAVGHEVDITISDLVSDLRASTPSAAAEMVVRSRDELKETLQGLHVRMRSAASLHISHMRHVLRDLATKRAFGALGARFRDQMQRVDDLSYRLRSHIDRRSERDRHRLALLRQRLSIRHMAERLSAVRATVTLRSRLLHGAVNTMLERNGGRIAAFGESLTALSPLAVLARGYSISRDEDSGVILKDTTGVRVGSRIRIRLHRGRLGCEVKEVEHATGQEGI